MNITTFWEAGLAVLWAAIGCDFWLSPLAINIASWTSKVDRRQRRVIRRKAMGKMTAKSATRTLEALSQS